MIKNELDVEVSKKELIEEILELTSIKGEEIVFNTKYIEYFELDELVDIRNQLLGIKQTNKSTGKDFLDDIFNKCS